VCWRKPCFVGKCFVDLHLGCFSGAVSRGVGEVGLEPVVLVGPERFMFQRERWLLGRGGGGVVQ